MPYRVELTLRAERDLERLYLEKNASESKAAARWFNGLEQAIYTLENLPRRSPVAPESKKTKRSLQHLLYGKKPHIYLVIYEIEERHHIVRVLTIRHGAMEPMEPKDLPYE